MTSGGDWSDERVYGVFLVSNDTRQQFEGLARATRFVFRTPLARRPGSGAQAGESPCMIVTACTSHRTHLVIAT